MILSTVIQLRKSINNRFFYFFILARKRAIAAIISSVERGFFAVPFVAAAVRLTLAVTPLVARTAELAFKVFALVLVLVVVVVVVVVVVLTVRGLYIEAKAFGRAAVLVVAVAVRFAVVLVAKVLGRAARVELFAVRLALVNELALVPRYTSDDYR